MVLLIDTILELLSLYIYNLLDNKFKIMISINK